ncbi:two-component system CheB/CheR fusion protein [Deinococcus metalli]|uniref:protein-glutamate O-methyltransferase n=1 Tax=Deinococcus metalli TaxID=1141878 RepID=A0A7W8NQA8_9DEIO|nr:CheR family methyltransferase [Deinococcus metalli]MBB5376610.1 two-component system CheB/CheR fusion protein [Deinococcus metalli]GHF42796.1 chemotaxis protein CheR [Deinococcus metalli]
MSDESFPKADLPLAPRAVVAIGGSAGALDGFERFFLGLPPGGGMAYVVVSHLSPEGTSLMPDLLRRCTPLPVQTVEDGVEVQADQVYMIPSNRSLGILNGRLLLDDLEQARGHTIDLFLSALAADQGEHAVAVILSGMGNDGTEGAHEIKKRRGLLLVQSPDSADYPAMPQSAVETGLADGVWSPEELAPRLYQMVTHEPLLQLSRSAQDSPFLHKILLLVRTQTGLDFTRYKATTLLRRIDRRMKGLHLDSLATYHQYLQRHTDEVVALMEDFTINVTSFFRDPEAFESLRAQLRPTIASRDRDAPPLRAWVVGCSTGEEAYSLAILLRELQEGTAGPPAQVFATDIDQRAIDRARHGEYPLSIEQQLSPDLLRRYFTRQGDTYTVIPSLRESVVFAVHDTFNDPPFTRLDLLSCRNMMIYLNTDLQKEILSVFHYALLPGGLLFLGASETIGLQEERFRSVDARWKLYRRGDAPATAVGGLSVQTHDPMSRLASWAGRRPAARMNLSLHAQQALLNTFTPPAVVVTISGEVQYVSGRTGRHLELAPGLNNTNNVLDMTRDGLRYELAATLRRAAQEKREFTLRDDRQPSGGGGYVTTDIIVQPFSHPDVEGLLLVVFVDHQSAEAPVRSVEHFDEARALQREMQALRAALQANREQTLITDEEFRTTNEEYLTTIEELKSTNEELMTSKEELQSVNEELVSTNTSHQQTIFELAQANDDMTNLLDSAGIATLFLGSDLRIKRFTPGVTALINLIPSDIGRHISDINLKLRDAALDRLVREALLTLSPVELPLQSTDGHWFLTRISPYRTAQNHIEGAVVAFTNIDAIRALEEQVTRYRDYADALLERSPSPMLVFDDDLRIQAANRALYDLMGLVPDSAVGERLPDLGDRQLDQWRLRDGLDALVLADTPLRDLVLDFVTPERRVRKLKAEAWSIVTEHTPALHVLQLEDVTPLMDSVEQQGAEFTGQAGDVSDMNNA